MKEIDIDKIGQRFDIENLPEELKKHLCIKKSRECIFRNILKSYDGIANLNEIIVAYFFETKKIFNRHKMSTYLSIMCKKGVLKKIGQGIYALNKDK